jgi:hypothetical protein
MWIDLIPLALLDPPSRLASLGRALVQLSATLLSLGLIAKAVLTAASVAMNFTRQPAPTSLSALYPDLPTWWVPEGVLGFVMVGALFFVGYVAKDLAAEIKKHAG